MGGHWLTRLYDMPILVKTLSINISESISLISFKLKYVVYNIMSDDMLVTHHSLYVNYFSSINKAGIGTCLALCLIRHLLRGGGEW